MSDKPTVIWRMHHGDGRSAHAMVGPHGHEAAAMWFLNGRPQNLHTFETWYDAIQWSERLRVELTTEGWRPID